MDMIKKAIKEALKETGSAMWSGTKNLAKKGFGAALPASYWICLFVSIICLILYISGDKKKGKYVTGSIVVYYLLECIGSVLL